MITPRRVAAAVSAISLILYLMTMNRTFGFVDKGEMVAAASTLGIPHPTGYPTLIVLGHLWTKIVPLRDVLALNILDALLTAVGVGVLALLFADLSRRIESGRTGTDPGEISPSDASASDSLCAGIAALLTALTAIWWDQSNGFEAYSLYTIMLPLTTLLFLRYVDREAERESGRTGASVSPAERIGFTRRGTIFALTLGIAFTAHLMTVLLAPAFLFYYFRRLGLTGRAFRRWLYLAPPFLAGLLLYLLLPIISATDPVIGMGKIDSLRRLTDYISGAQFQVWMFSGWKVFRSQTTFFLENLPHDMAYAGVVVALLGGIHLFRRNRLLGVTVLLIFLSCILYAGQFSIKEIEPYYLNAIFALGICSLAGLLWLRDLLGRNVMLAFGTILLGLAVMFNYSAVDESGNTLVENFTRNMLGSLPDNAIIFSTRWDFWVSGSYYLQAVEGVRSDVTVINPNLLRSPDYIAYFRELHPDLVEKSDPQIGRFIRLLDSLDDIPMRYSRADTLYTIAYANMLNSIIRENWRKHPILVTAEISPAIGKGLVRVPYYLAYILRPDSTYYPQAFNRFDNFRFWEERVDADAMNIYEHYTLSFLRRADYEGRHGNAALADRYVTRALEFDPRFDEEDVPPLPLNNREQVIRVIRSYRDVRRRVEGLRAR